MNRKLLIVCEKDKNGLAVWSAGPREHGQSAGGQVDLGCVGWTVRSGHMRGTATMSLAYRDVAVLMHYEEERLRHFVRVHRPAAHPRRDERAQTQVPHYFLPEIAT